MNGERTMLCAANSSLKVTAPCSPCADRAKQRTLRQHRYILCETLNQNQNDRFFPDNCREWQVILDILGLGFPLNVVPLDFLFVQGVEVGELGATQDVPDVGQEREGAL